MGSDPPHETITFCSIAKGKDIIYSYSAKGSSDGKDLASIWLEKSPQLHVWYSHTAESKIIALLYEDEYIFFAINEPNSGNLDTMFLKSLRAEFKKATKKSEFQSEMDSAVHHLITPICLPPPPMHTYCTSTTPKASDRSKRMTSGTAHDRKKLKDRGSDLGCVGDCNFDNGLKIDVGHENFNGVNAISFRRSLSSKLRHQQHLMKLWWIHVKIAVAIDAFICLLLFGVWLMICRGFECLS